MVKNISKALMALMALKKQISLDIKDIKDMTLTFEWEKSRRRAC